jgi:hypothetical protein
VEEEVEISSKVFIIPEQKHGVIVSYGAYMSAIKYHDGFEEVIEPFDANDFIILNEIQINKEGK